MINLDAVVNSACPYGKPVSSTEEFLANWDSNMAVLLKGPLLSVLHAKESLASGGSIVNISSMVAFGITHQPAGYHVESALNMIESNLGK